MEKLTKGKDLPEILQQIEDDTSVDVEGVKEKLRQEAEASTETEKGN